MTKRIVTLLIAIVMILACLFAVSSCKKHKHSYELTNVPATCTEDGSKVYTCSCGDSYTEAGEKALGHSLKTVKGDAGSCTTASYGDYEMCTRCDYSTKVEGNAGGHCYKILDIVYPTLEEDGAKTVKCEVCGDSRTLKIQATSKSLPKASRILAAFLGELSLSLKSGDTYFTNGRVTEAPNQNSYKTSTKVKLGDFNLTTKDGVPQGYLKLELLQYDVNLSAGQSYDGAKGTYERLGEIYAYLNGDVISYEVTGPNMETQKDDLDVNAIFYKFIANYMGMNDEQFSKFTYVVGEFSTVTDDLLNLAKALAEVELPEATAEYLDETLALLESVFGDLITVEDGFGGKKTYTTNISALCGLIEALEGETVESYINKIGGSNAADDLHAFALNLPTMKLREVANFAINFAEESGMSTNAVFAFVDTLIYVSYGQSISIQAEIQNNYDKTICDLTGADAADLKDQIALTIDEIYEYTIDNLVEYLFGSSADVEYIKDSIKSLDEYLYLTFTLDKNSELISLEASYLGVVTINLTQTSFSVKATSSYMDKYGEYQQATLLDFKGTIKDGEIVSFTLDVNALYGEYDYYYDESLEMYIHKYYQSVQDAFNASYSNNYFYLDAGDVTVTATVDESVRDTVKISITVSHEDEGKVGSAQIVYTDKSTADVINASLSLKLEARGFDVIDFRTTIENDVLIESYLKFNAIEEDTIWHEGYYETIWVEGYWYTYWVDGYWAEEWVDVYDEYGYWVDGYWQEYWVEGYWDEFWVDGYSDENWHPGYYEYLGTYYVATTLEAKYNKGGKLELSVTNEGGTSVSASLKEEGDGYRIIFAVDSEYEYNTTVYPDDYYYGDPVQYPVHSYTDIHFDLYFEVK